MTSLSNLSNPNNSPVSNHEFKLIFETSSGEKLYLGEDSIVLKLPKKRNSITT